MDNLVFEESINAEIEQSEFISKKWVYVNDNNSQNYSTQVVIDTTSIANSGAYVNWQESYIVAPLILGVSCNNARFSTDGSQNAKVCEAIGLKNGFWNIVNSFNIEYNNQTVVQQTAFTNVHRSFKAHTSFSQDDLKNEAMTLGYYPDTPNTWSFKASPGNANGVGVINTENNTGFATRNSWIYGQTANQTTVMPLASRSDNFSSTFTVESTTKAYFTIYAKLRLKDLADFFGKTPLLKGSTIRLLINTNQVTNFSITYGAALITTVSTPSLQGYSNPVMVDTEKLATLTGVASGDVFNFSLSIVKDYTSTATAGNSSLKSWRLYAPIYKMNPIAEQRYLSLAPTKKVHYNDIFQYQFSGIGATDNFNILVTNGITNIKSVLVVPFLTATANGGISPHQSPYSTAGATPDPIVITNFNILVSGVNLFQQNELYDFEIFNHELKSSNQLNGNLTTGLTSGLIGEYEFSNLYRYYYGNCARILPSEEGVSRSVQIVGQVKTDASLTINLMVFVEFQKTIEIDISTGARIE